MHDSNSQSAAGKVEISSASRRSIPNVASASVGTEENVNFASTGSATLSSNSLSRTYSVDSNGDRFSGLNDLSINSTANGEAGAANTTGAASAVNSHRWTYDEVLDALQAYEETLLEVFGLLVDGEMLDSKTFGSDTGHGDSSGSDSERDSDDGESEGETMGLVRI